MYQAPMKRGLQTDKNKQQQQVRKERENDPMCNWAIMQYYAIKLTNIE